MKSQTPIFLALLLVLSSAPGPTVAAQDASKASASPPFNGTIFLDSTIIVAADPTAFQRLSYAGQGMRTMFDRRVNNWITANAFLYDAVFRRSNGVDSFVVEIQVNPEFGTPEAAQVQAEVFAPVIGRLPEALRTDLETVWIHMGTQPFGGGNNNLLIHVGQADAYRAAGILEETLVHEASHTSLDAYHAAAPGWVAAQQADGDFISTYARDNPTREDIAETFLTYLAVRIRPEQISTSLYDTIQATVPNRIAYFDSLKLDMYPMLGLALDTERDPLPGRQGRLENYPNPFRDETTIRLELERPGFARMTVFDALGREVDRLMAGIYPAGVYEMPWHAAGQPPGLYLGRLEEGGASRTLKLLVVR
ncbi:MAG: T9SS type A sorting domain-containing protein [Rhodothermales bacterium]